MIEIGLSRTNEIILFSAGALSLTRSTGEQSWTCPYWRTRTLWLPLRRTALCTSGGLTWLQPLASRGSNKRRFHQVMTTAADAWFCFNLSFSGVSVSGSTVIRTLNPEEGPAMCVQHFNTDVSSLVCYATQVDPDKL